MQDEPKIELPVDDEKTPQEQAEAQVKLSRRKRGAGPVCGMPCEAGYKLIGDSCIKANVEFE